MPLATLRTFPLLLLPAALPLGAAAADAVPSRIAEVTLYPGTAVVQRVARVPAGTRTLRFDCLPAALDPASLQVTADEGVQVGETTVLTEERALSAACRDNPLDAQIRALEDRRAALQAEFDALGFVTGYLRGLGAGKEGEGAPRAAADPKAVAATADALRRTGQDALLRQHQITRAQTDLDVQLAPLRAERQRAQGQGAQGQGGRVAAVTVTVAAPREAGLLLSYRVRGPGWTPAYRASLDSTTRRLRIERQALVAQASGEDWRGVRLRLSTGQPLRASAGREPQPWRLGIAAPAPVSPPEGVQARSRFAMAAAPVAAPAPAPAPAGDQAPPLFEIDQQDQAFATEFRVPQPIDVPSDGQRVALVLGQHADTAALVVRASPRIEPAAYLFAEFAPPPGVWPAGPLQLYRDGAFAGTARWSPPEGARASLSFGVDERVRVQAEPERDNQGSGGFAGSRAERRVQRAYVVENRHAEPIVVQVLEAAPVAVDERVRVQAQFAPEPAEREWQRKPGVAAWRSELAAGASARFTADYRIDYPKDERLEPR